MKTLVCALALFGLVACKSRQDQGEAEVKAGYQELGLIKSIEELQIEVDRVYKCFQKRHSDWSLDCWWDESKKIVNILFLGDFDELKDKYQDGLNKLARMSWERSLANEAFLMSNNAVTRKALEKIDGQIRQINEENRGTLLQIQAELRKQGVNLEEAAIRNLLKTPDGRSMARMQTVFGAARKVLLQIKDLADKNPGNNLRYQKAYFTLINVLDYMQVQYMYTVKAQLAALDKLEAKFVARRDSVKELMKKPFTETQGKVRMSILNQMSTNLKVTPIFREYLKTNLDKVMAKNNEVVANVKDSYEALSATADTAQLQGMIQYSIDLYANITAIAGELPQMTEIPQESFDEVLLQMNGG